MTTYDIMMKNRLLAMPLFGSFATGTATEYSDIDFVETYIILFERFRDENKKFYENWDMDEMHFE